MEGEGSLWSQYESNFVHHNTMMDHHSTSSPASLESQFQKMRIGTPRNSSSNYTRILEDVSGSRSIVLMARDRQGSEILITRLKGRNPQEITNILYEVISNNDIHNLMMHPYGYRFMRALFEVISVRHINIIIDIIFQSEHKFVQVCSNDNGSYAMQDLVRYIFTAEKLFDFTMALKRNIVLLANNLNAGYVILKCLTIFPNILCKEILNGVARNCILIATHKDGCCVIQKLLDQANHESSYQLVRKIIAYAPLLAPDPYGNYVLQFVIEKQDVSLNIALIVGRLEGKFVELSMNKFGSHVVENLLKNSTMRLVGLIIQEIMISPQFSNVLQCRFGNYVAQQALRFSVRSGVHNTLVNSIIFYEVYLQDHPYGKKVLASARRAQLKLQQLAT